MTRSRGGSARAWRRAQARVTSGLRRLASLIAGISASACPRRSKTGYGFAAASLSSRDSRSSTSFSSASSSKTK
jgi:hypothetical protein